MKKKDLSISMEGMSHEQHDMEELLMYVTRKLSEEDEEQLSVPSIEKEVKKNSIQYGSLEITRTRWNASGILSTLLGHYRRYSI